MGIYQRWGKRALDLIASAIGLVALAPVCAAVTVASLWFLGIPVLFRQRRPGLRGEAFEILKFRTMAEERDAEGRVLADDRRLGWYGRFLRATSLDEVPELWNVLRGEMSLVGPRPLLMEYLPLYSKRQQRRHDAMPGVTGWAQVNGRNEVSWEKKFEMDVWYVENASFCLDLRILFLTVLAVVWRRGISASGHVSMPRFTGSGAGE